MSTTPNFYRQHVLERRGADVVVIKPLLFCGYHGQPCAFVSGRDAADRARAIVDEIMAEQAAERAAGVWPEDKRHRRQA